MVSSVYNGIPEKAMNTNSEMFDAKNDLSSKLAQAHDLLIKSSKIAAILGAICGFIYLFAYTTHVGIPFPLELTVLPTTLLIVGLTSIVGTFILIAGVFIPALTLEYNDEVTKNYRSATDLEDRVIEARFIRYFLCTWAPTALALIGFILSLGLIGDSTWLKFAGGLSVFTSAAWIFYTPKYVGVFVENRFQYLFINFLHTILSVFAYSLILVITILAFPDFKSWNALAGCLVALVVFTLCQIVIFVPTSKHNQTKILLPPNYKGETTPTMGVAFVLAAVWTALTVIMPQINYKIGGAALRAFHVGGNVPVAICLKTKPADLISRRFNFDADFCSEKILMQLDSGDRVYVSKMSSVDALGKQQDILQPEAVYFRQDEIKQKIYFQKKNVR